MTNVFFKYLKKILKKSVTRVKKYDIFIDYDQLNCKKIVTEVEDDGSFTAVDLGEWLEEQDVYDISVIEDDENTGWNISRFTMHKI